MPRRANDFRVFGTLKIFAHMMLEQLPEPMRQRRAFEAKASAAYGALRLQALDLDRDGKVTAAEVEAVLQERDALARELSASRAREEAHRAEAEALAELLG